jgi:hypothetical protein
VVKFDYNELKEKILNHLHESDRIGNSKKRRVYTHPIKLSSEGEKQWLRKRKSGSLFVIVTEPVLVENV